MIERIKRIFDAPNILSTKHYIVIAIGFILLLIALLLPIESNIRFMLTITGGLIGLGTPIIALIRADELERRIYMDAAAYSGVFTFVILALSPPLEQLNLPAITNLEWVWVIMVVAWGFFHTILRWKHV